jgi:single-strand DNA-binding protein
MAGVNKAIVLGNLGQDPEIRYSKQGTPVVNFSVATSEKWTDKNTQQVNEQTEWHRVTVFGKQAENCNKYLSKGSKVYVEGKLKTTSYDKEGQTHYSTNIIASIVQFIGGRQDGGAYAPAGNFASQNGQYQNTGGGYQQQPMQPPPMQNTNVKDDDIPF